MKKETPAIRRRTRSNPKSNHGGRLKLYSLMFVCLLVVVSGFFFGARQHFSSVDYSMRNSKLRKQLDELESEKRRLLLAREVSLSPAEIKRAARKLGIDNAGTSSVQLASASKDIKQAGPQLTSAKASADTQPSLVVRTAYVASTARVTATGTAKPDPLARPRRVQPSAAASLRSRSAE